MTGVVLLAAAGAAWEPDALALLEQTPGLVVLKRCVDLDDLLAAAASGQANAAAVAGDLPGLDAVAVDQLRHHGVRTVAVVRPGPAADAARTRAARAGLTRVVAEDALAGLAEALTSPDQPAQEHDPEAPVSPLTTPPPPLPGRRVMAVWGPAGAPGRTTVAIGIAAELARRRLPTVLVDADPNGGAVAPMLGVLDEVSGLLSAGRLSVAGELPDRLPSVLRALGPDLAVLTGLPRADRWPELRPGLVGEIAERAARQCQVVIDTGLSLEDDGAEALGRTGRHQLTLDALDAADDVVVVGTADPVGLHRLARGLVDLRERIPAPPYVVVNRMRPTLGWSEREVEAMLAGVVHTASIHFLPEDRAAVDRATMAGRTLLETAADGPLPRAISKLVDALADASAPPLPGRRVARRRRLPARRRLSPSPPTD
jgi:MinD-like ATPase involved in chromosome partitioning or flagellar assembly